MADEILYAGVANQRVAESLSTDFIMLAADRESLPNHPALFYAGDLFGSGSNTKKVAHAGIMGYDLPVAVADGAQVARTTWSTGATTVAVGRRSKAYAPSDLARFTDPVGLLRGEMFARDASASHMLALTSVIASLMGGFSNVAGSSGTDLSIANVLAALTFVEVGYQGAIAPGMAMGLIHTQQGADLRSALATSTAGAIQWQTTPDQLAIKGNGFRGRYLDVDWFVSGHVPTANSGADRAGGVFVRGAVVYCDMSQVAESTDQLLIGGKVLFERDRDAKGALTDYVSHSHFGAGEGIDAFGAALITDA